MGNRAVISIGTEHKSTNNGIYLHWDGSPKDIEHFLDLARSRMAERLGDSSYGTARLIQVIGDCIDGNLSFGVGLCSELDPDPDNGIYLVHPESLEVIGNY